MTVMHMFLVVANGVAMGLLGVFGIAGIATGWVAPWGRGRVLRPRLWGSGSLLSGVGGAFFVFLGPLAAGRHTVLPWLGWVAFMVGLGLQMLAQRPGRPLTRNAS
ncbi:hypothetical protein [Streptomyces sp. NPDC046759]|uniref:hypothetical protein n=1 Tax=Streptomyces sp. NPDC046759 TaxID=3155019 RepID=UPI003410FB93